MIVGDTATFTGTSAAESIAIDQSGGLLRHNRFSAGDSGFSSEFDFNSTVAGDQTLSATNPSVNIIINAGGGDDTFKVGSAVRPASLLVASFVFNGEGGNNQATLDDTANDVGRIVVITPNTVAGLGGLVTLTDLQSLTIHGGSGGDQFQVLGTSDATSINAGGGDDSVIFSDGATLSGGGLDGGSRTNTLDYSAYTSTVTVDLAPGSARTLFAALLSARRNPDRFRLHRAAASASSP